jgi:hypothetical protein
MSFPVYETLIPLLHVSLADSFPTSRMARGGLQKFRSLNCDRCRNSTKVEIDPICNWYICNS